MVPVEDMLQADLDTLHRLGATLAGHADAIDQIRISDTVTMPDSPIQAVSSQVNDAVVTAYKLIGDNIRRMSDGSKSAAETYEKTDQAFAGQLHRYIAGE
ncbi:hypothetical protein [Nocardia sp. NPDC051570]|uniref:hypothetical protein n=1 Tax=Nocardia sp. NPDC051570 TaxID=3364324 RepID=UPI0037880608